MKSIYQDNRFAKTVTFRNMPPAEHESDFAGPFAIKAMPIGRRSTARQVVMAAAVYQLPADMQGSACHLNTVLSKILAIATIREWRGQHGDGWPTSLVLPLNQPFALSDRVALNLGLITDTAMQSMDAGLSNDECNNILISIRNWYQGSTEQIHWLVGLEFDRIVRFDDFEIKQIPAQQEHITWDMLHARLGDVEEDDDDDGGDAQVANEATQAANEAAQAAQAAQAAVQTDAQATLAVANQDREVSRVSAPMHELLSGCYE